MILIYIIPVAPVEATDSEFCSHFVDYKWAFYIELPFSCGTGQKVA